MVIDPTQGDADSMTTHHDKTHQPELLTGGFNERIIIPTQKEEISVLSVES